MYVLCLVTAGNNGAQMLRTWGSTSCPESDDNDSNYFADDETSPYSSPSRNNDVSELENTEGKHRILNSQFILHHVKFTQLA